MAVIFLRKPKCAGTSIRSMLKQNVGALRPEQVHHYDRWDCCVIGAFEIELWEDQQWFKDAWKFTVIRNVWDRAISGWLHCPTLRKRPFADVVANPPQKSEDHYGWHHFARLQKEFLISPETGKLRANYVIPFEQLRPSLRVVWSKFGIQPPRMLHQNAGPSRHHYSHYFDDATLKRFNELFAEDIELITELNPTHEFKFERVFDQSIKEPADQKPNQG